MPFVQTLGEPLFDDMTLKLHDLIEHVKHENRLPEIMGDHCVHALIETASCHACIEACPQNAWILDDESLGLDTEACDGCGLCAPACPQGAITNRDHAITIREWRGQLIALSACECVAPISNEGVIPCIHSLGLQDILLLLQRGVRQLMMAPANCDECERGGGKRLSDRVTSLNDALQKMQGTGIKLSTWPLAAWQKLLKHETVSPGGAHVNRRGFLRSLVGTNAEQGGAQSDLFLPGDAPFVPPGRLIHNPSIQTRWPYLPDIDASRCNGCDACVKLCPHGAIALDKTDNQSCYRLNPKNCSGCSICVDVCEQTAVVLHQWELQKGHIVDLKDACCTACGTPFHVPTDYPLPGNVMCRICSENNHYKNLHQFLV